VVETPARYCSNCGRELNPEDQFCSNCGHPVHQTASVPTPEADVPVPPPQQQQAWETSTPLQQPQPPRRSTANKIFVGCAGLVVVLVLFVGCLAVLAGGGGNQQPSGSGGEEAAQKQPGTTKQNPVSIGDPVRAGKVEWNVTNARQVTELKAPYSGAKQGNFVIVDFNFTNFTKESVTLDTRSLTLIDSEGRKFEADTDAYEYVPTHKNIILEQVNPGVTKQGETIFTVAPGASGFILKAGDMDMFSDRNAYIDLGF
jgi:Domain of unknown function (DUF4352)/zinc-ribbon domain